MREPMGIEDLMDLHAMMDTPLREQAPPGATPPAGHVAVARMSSGEEVRFALSYRYRGTVPDRYDDPTHMWDVLVDGDPNAIMPHVFKVQGPPLLRGQALSFGSGPGWDSQTWGRRVLENSRDVFGWWEPGTAASRETP